MAGGFTFKTFALLAVAGVTLAQDNVFPKDDRLHQSFYGLAYTPPLATNLPACGDTIQGVMHDIQLMSQLTTRLRLYGADCGTSDLVLEAINRTQVNMEVFLGIYLQPTAINGTADTEAIYSRMLAANLAALQKWGTRNVAGLTVGNEYILQQTRGGQTQAEAEQYVLSKIADTRAKVQALNLDKQIPIGSADAGGLITTSLAEGSDYVFANVHSWFANVVIQDAPAWTFHSLLNDQPASALQASNKPPLYSAEVGWPTNATTPTVPLTRNSSIASIENTQFLLDNFVCTANAMPQNQSSGWFWFEFADAAWKLPLGGVEPYWGLFDSNRNLKPLTIPTCLANAAVLPPLPSDAHTLPPVSSATGTGTNGPQPTGAAASGPAVVLGSLAITMAAAIVSLIL